MEDEVTTEENQNPETEQAQTESTDVENPTGGVSETEQKNELSPEELKARNSENAKRRIEERNRREQEQLREEIAALKDQIASNSQPYQEAQEPIQPVVQPQLQPGEPDIRNYADANKWANDHFDWKMRRAAQEQQHRQVKSKKESLVNEYSLENPNFRTNILGATSAGGHLEYISSEVTEMLLDETAGLAMLDKMALNPSYAQKVQGMTKRQIYNEMNDIESQRSKGATQTTASTASKPLSVPNIDSSRETNIYDLDPMEYLHEMAKRGK